jgi:hypothetical protein
MTGIWRTGRDCTCTESVQQSAGTVTVDEHTYCRMCRCKRTPSQCATCGAVHEPSDKFCASCGTALASAARATAATPNTTAAPPPAHPSNPVAPSAASEPSTDVRKRSIARFKVLYGIGDPVLWIALFMGVPAAFGYNDRLDVVMIGIGAGTAWIFVIADVLRWPIAIATRAVRLNNAKPASTDPVWEPDPARLGQQRLWDGAAWTSQVAGPPPRPESWVTIATVGVGMLLVVGTTLGIAAGGGYL